MPSPLDALRRLADALPEDGSAVLSTAYLRAVVASLPATPPAADYSISEAARVLGVSRDTVRRLIKARHLAAHRVGSAWRIRPTVLEQYRAAGSPAPPQTTTRPADLSAWRTARRGILK